MAERVDFHYRLTGVGWGDGTLRVSDSVLEITASYLGDALGDLLDALVSLTDGAPSATVSWWDEPGEYWWKFTRQRGQIRVRIREYPDSREASEPQSHGKLLFDETCELTDFVKGVTSRARSVLDEHGAVGYRKKWDRYDFPESQLAALEAWLTEQDT